MKAVLCVDIEPDARTPDPTVAVAWVGAERLLENPDRLRNRLGGQVINWYLRLDHQVEFLHGDLCWAAERFAGELDRLSRSGDEIGAHPHNWRWTGEAWLPDGTTSWVVENAERSLEAYEAIFGIGPPSFRYGDRFVSNEVVRLLSDHPDVAVDLTIEPGAPACRGLVSAEGALDVTRHVDAALARRRHPDPDAVDLTSDTGHLTMVPLTTAPIAGTGIVDTLTLWRQPEEFDRMLRIRLLDDQLDHLAFAIRSDLALWPWAIENMEANLETLARHVADLEWVRASSLALACDVAGDQGLGLVGSLATTVHDVIRVVHPDSPIIVPPLAETVHSIVRHRDELADRVIATSAALIEVEQQLATARGHVATLSDEVVAERQRADDVGGRLEAIERTTLWRVRMRLLPVLRPLVGALHPARRWLTTRSNLT